MSIAIQRTGYGQVEPNHLSAQYNGKIYAQLPALTIDGTTKTPIAQLEQGQFLKYDYAHGAADVSGEGEWLLVYCEEKLYDERRQNHKDFVMLASDNSDGKIYPRLFKTDVGDIFTTNTIGSGNTGPDTQMGSSVSLQVTDKLVVNEYGFLEKAGTNPTGMIWQVVEETTAPDAKEKAVKIQRIQ